MVTAAKLRTMEGFNGLCSFGRLGGDQVRSLKKIVSALTMAMLPVLNVFLILFLLMSIGAHDPRRDSHGAVLGQSRDRHATVTGQSRGSHGAATGFAWLARSASWQGAWTALRQGGRGSRALT